MSIKILNSLAQESFSLRVCCLIRFQICCRIPLSNVLSNLLSERMPCIGSMRAGVTVSDVHSLSHFFCLQFFSECPNFYRRFENLASQACKPVHHGAVSIRSLAAQQCRKSDKLWIGNVCHTLGKSKPLQSRSLLKPLVAARPHGTRISSVRNQALEDASFDSYKTLALPCTSALEVKKSKFIAAATSVNDEVAALSFLSQIRDSSASHNCWAFKIGDRTRFSDDGEPGGTAGRPMLTAITSSGIDHVMVVVTRFFGGTKLGTGGLVRAYGKVTSDCLKDANTVIIKAKVFLKIRAPYDVLGLLYPLLQAHGVQKLEENFDVEGEGGVTMSLMIDAENLRFFEKDVELTSKGRASLSDVVTC